MAQKSAQPVVVLNVEEALDVIDKTMERVKSLYEQYFLGIQKQPPTFIHNDLERKLRDLAQVQIRNTALRYRYATLQQKFGSYNSYWRRTLRQIENGTYVRQLAKIGRKSAESGEDLPEEILAKMPKRMRDQVRRDREAALALAERRKQLEQAEQVDGGGDFYEQLSKPAAPAARVDARGAHVLDEDDGDLDLDKFFAAVEADEENEATESGPPPQPPPPAAPVAPANQRAAILGGLPRAQSPAVRAQTQAEIPVTRSQPAAQPLGSTFAKTQGVPVVPEPIPPTPTPTPRPVVPMPARGPTQVVPVVPPVIPGRASQPAIPPQRASQPVVPGQLPPVPPPGARPAQPVLPPLPSPGVPRATEPLRTQPLPTIGRPPAPSQVSRPIPVAPGASDNKSVPVETMSGPFAREPSVTAPPRRAKRDTDLDAGIEVPQAPTPPPMRPSQTPPPMRPVSTPQRPSQPLGRPAPARPAAKAPPGMTDADVDSLYQKYVKAKEMVGETTNAQTYGKLLNTINAQAPKIMEQYKAKGVDFSVVVKDNQVIIKAKPKP